MSKIPQTNTPIFSDLYDMQPPNAWAINNHTNACYVIIYQNKHDKLYEYTFDTPQQAEKASSDLARHWRHVNRK